MSATADGVDPDQFNPHDPAFLADPFPTYARFREQAPAVHRVELYKSDWLFRYQDCRAFLKATEVWVKAPPGPRRQVHGPYGFSQANFPTGLFNADPPLHEELRSVLEPLFCEAIRTAPELTRGLAEPLLAQAAQHGRIELVSDYALPLPSQVLFTLLGIPDEPGIWEGLVNFANAIAAAHDITESPGVLAAGATSSMAVSHFFEALEIADRSGGHGLFAQFCAAFATAGLSSQQLQMVAVDFLVAGYLSTTFIIATGTWRLLQNPDQLAKLRAQPSLIAGAVEEMIRYDGPVQVIDRFAAVDTDLAGRHYEAGAKVTAVVGAGDHDPDTFADPEAFRIDRDPNPHLGFGAGIHICIGAPLVRLVAPVAFQLLLDAFPNLALAGVPQWQTDPYLRSVTNLPLVTG